MAEAGYGLLRTLTVERFDLATIGPAGEIRRVQVKTGKLKRGCVEANACSVNYDKRSARRYVGEVDDIAVYCPQNDAVYLVPMEIVGVRTKLYLRVTEPRSVRPDLRATLLRAADFLLERETRVELAASSLARTRSTTELLPHESSVGNKSGEDNSVRP